MAARGRVAERIAATGRKSLRPVKSYLRREFLSAVGLMSVPVALRAQLMMPVRQRPQELLLYVGTYTAPAGRGEGIYIYRLNLSTGALTHLSTAKDVVSPSFLAIGSSRRHLYCVNEVTELANQASGAVSAFAIDQKSGALRFLNQQLSLGGAPCFITVEAAEKFVLVANYMGGSVTVLPVRADGSLGEPPNKVQHRGRGPNSERQEGPHAHSIILDQSQTHAFAADLGLDQILIYNFDRQRGQLAPHDPPAINVKPGAGPRHFTFHPNEKYAYVINELDSTITAFAFDRRRAALRALQTVSTLPPNFTGQNSCADIHISPAGMFLYGSNRGHNSIVVFAIDQRSGRLRLVQHESTQGQTPRNFAIDPTGTFLLAANQDSDTIVSFRLDSAKGQLTPTGQVTKVPSPVCLKMIASFA